MPEVPYILAAVAVAASITWLLRALPFALLAPLQESRLLPYLGDRLAVGVMVILVIYTLQGLDLMCPSVAVPAAIALAVTAGLHLWRGSMVLSLVAGTLTHVVLASAWPG